MYFTSFLFKLDDFICFFFFYCCRKKWYSVLRTFVSISKQGCFPLTIPLSHKKNRTKQSKNIRIWRLPSTISQVLHLKMKTAGVWTNFCFEEDKIDDFSLYLLLSISTTLDLVYKLDIKCLQRVERRRADPLGNLGPKGWHGGEIHQYPRLEVKKSATQWHQRTQKGSPQKCVLSSERIRKKQSGKTSIW